MAKKAARNIKTAGRKKAQEQAVRTVAQRAAQTVRPEKSTPTVKREVNLPKLLVYFQAWLRGDKRVGGLRKIAKELGVDHKTIRRGLKDAVALGSIRISEPTDEAVEAAMGTAWHGPQYHALNVDDSTLFYFGAAEIFLERLNDLLKMRSSSSPLAIGIVSGSTVGKTLAAMCKMKWDSRLRKDILPEKLSVYALNVSHTHGFSELGNNATILAYELARKFNDECPGMEVEAYGLPAELFQTTDAAQITDVGPEIQKVLEVTDPVRLAKSLADQQRGGDAGTLKSESQLDVIITGVGGLTESLFTTYCGQHKIEIKDLKEHGHVVGDIAYWPVTKRGELYSLEDQDNKYVFYSAVSLDVLKSLSDNPNRRVVLIVQYRYES